jgi:hypothetical protein
MTYNKQFTVLGGIIAGLALVFILTIIFNPERRGARSAAYSWLEPGQNDRINGITITKPDETITLARNGGRWFVTHDGRDYPARDSRIEDLIAALGKRAPYPVRSTGASSHERLSLNENQAVRISVAAGAGPPLLTLLIGQQDVTGQDIYLRKQGQNEVRSGEDIFSTYTRQNLSSWYNLRLFPETEGGKLDATNVQRLIIYATMDDRIDGTSTTPRIFTRKGREWTFNFELANPDMKKVDNYVHDILFVSGDDFVNSVSSTDALFNNSRFVLELGDGSTRTLRLGPPDENGIRYATVSGSNWVYSVPNWISHRLFVDPENFETGQNGDDYSF